MVSKSLAVLAKGSELPFTVISETSSSHDPKNAGSGRFSDEPFAWDLFRKEILKSLIVRTSSLFRSASELIAKMVPEAIPEWKATDLELSEKTRRLLKEKELCQARGDFAGHRGVVAALLKVQDEMETNIFIAAPEEAEALRKSSFRIDQAIIGEYLNGTLTPESENLSGVGTRFQARLELIKNSESGSVEKISELGEWLAVAVAYVEILRAEGYEASACDLQHAVASLGDEADEAIDRWVASFSDLSEEERGVLSGDFKSVFEKAAEGGDAGFLFSLGERSLLAWKQDWSFARSLELVADDAETKMEVAGEYAGLGLRGAALRLIDQAHLQAQSLEVGPKVLRLYDLFELCLKAGDVDRAQETLRDLVDLGKNPEAPRGIVSLGALGEGILALQVGKAEEARKIFSSLQEKGGEVAPEIQSLASAYMKSMDQGEAARRNAQTLDVFSTVLAVRFEKLKSAGRTDEAIKMEREVRIALLDMDQKVRTGRFSSLWEAYLQGGYGSEVNEFFRPRFSGDYQSFYKEFLREVSDPRLDFDGLVLDFASNLVSDERNIDEGKDFDTAATLLDLLTERGSSQVAAQAGSLREAIDSDLTWIGRKKMIRTGLTMTPWGAAMTLLSAGSDQEVKNSLVDAGIGLGSLGFARAAKIAAMGTFACSPAAQLIASPGIRKATAWVIGIGTEAAAFTLANMSGQSWVSGNDYHWSSEQFWQGFGSNLVLFTVLPLAGTLTKSLGNSLESRPMLAQANPLLAAAQKAAGGFALNSSGSLLLAGGQKIFSVGTLEGGGYLEEGAMSWVSSLMGWRFHANGGGFLDRTVDAFLTDWQMGRMNSALGNLTGGALDKSETAIQALLKSRLNLAFAKPMVGHLAAAGVGLAALFPSVAEAMTTQGSALNLSPWYSLFVATGLFLPALGMAKMKFPDTTTASPDFMTGGNGRHNKEATFLAKCIAKRLKEEHGIEVELTELQKKVHQEFGVGNKENSRGSYNGNVPKEKWPEIIDSLTSYYSGKKQSEASMEYAGQAVSSNIYVELVKQAPVDSELRKTWKAMSPEKQSDLAKEIQQPLESAVQNILEMYGYPSLQEVEPDMMFMVMEEIAVCRDKIYAEKLGHSGEKGIYQATSNVSGWKAAGGWAALGVGIKGMFSPESAHALEKGAQEAISGDGALNFILSGPGILAIAAGLYLIYKIFPKPILERKYEVLEANFRKVAVEKGVSLNGWQAPYRKLVLNLIQGRFLILPNMEEIHGLLLENYRKALGVGISQSEFFQYFLKLTDKNVVDSMDQSHRSGYIRGILYNFQNYLPSFQGHPWAFEKISDTLQQIFLHFKDRASVPEFQEVAMALVSPQVLAAFDGNAEQIRSFAEAVRNFTTRDFGLINLQQILPALRRFGVEAGRLAEVFLGIKQTRSLNNAAPGLRELLAHSSDFNAVADNELVFFILPNSTYEHLQQSPGLWNYLVGMDKNQAFKTWNDMAPNERLANRLFGVSGEQLKTIGNVVQVPRADARNMSHSRTYHFFLTKPSNRPFFERFFHQFVLGDHWVRLALGEIMGGRAKFHFMEMIPALPNSIFSIDAPVTATFFDIVEILKKDRSRTSYQVGDQLVPVEDLAALWELEDPEYAPPASIRFLSLPEKLAQASAQGGPLIQELFQDAHIKFSGKGIQITLAKPLTTSQREEVLKEIHAQESVLKGLFWEIQFQPKPPMVETMDTIPDGVVNIKDLAEFTHAKGFTLKIQEP